MFLLVINVPFSDNETELERLETCVERYYDEIRAGFMPLRVDGYSNSESSHKANLRTARLRSNRVKSELIARQGLTEDCFITKNHAGKGDYVTVRLTIPKDETPPVTSEKEEKPAAPDETEKSDNALVNNGKVTPAEEPQAQPVQAEQPQADEIAQAIPVEKEGKADAYRFSLRANLSTACGASSYTARGLRGRGAIKTEGMPCGKSRPKCAII